MLEIKADDQGTVAHKLIGPAPPPHEGYTFAKNSAPLLFRDLSWLIYNAVYDPIVVQRCQLPCQIV